MFVKSALFYSLSVWFLCLILVGLPLLLRSGEFGRIAFTSNRDGTYQLFVLEMDANHLINVSNNQYQETEPVWSPDGQQLAFETNRDGDTNDEIYLLDLPSGVTRNLSNRPGNDQSPSWSPDGRSIAFIDVYSDLVSIVDVTSGHIQNFSVQVMSTPAWSPDGQYLAFRGLEGEDNHEIFLLNVATGVIRNLSNHSAFEWYSTWSPNADRLAFSSQRDFSNQVYVMDMQTASFFRLSPDDGNDYSIPAWSPDGRYIAVKVNDYTSDMEIALLDAESGVPDPDTFRLPGSVTNIIWASWGQYIFAEVRMGGADVDIFLIDVTRHQVHNLTRHAGNDWSPIWSHS
jgi:TolB protein